MDKQQFVDELTEDQLDLVAGGLIKNGGRGGGDFWDGSEEYGNP